MISLLIIGGSDAGISAALRAREVDSTAEVTVLVADSFANYSICGLPFYLSGEVPDWHALAHRTEEEIRSTGVRLLLRHKAQAIDPVEHTVMVIDEGGHAQRIPYDRLVIATGAEPVRPHLTGLDLPGVYLLRSMEDSFAIEQQLSTMAPRRAVIIGGGYIGLEMADALTRRGLAVTVVEHHPSVLKTVDEELGRCVHAELERHGVEVVTGVSIERITRDGAQVQVHGSQDVTRQADLVLVATGVRPATHLAQIAGIRTGDRGAICVTPRMETNLSAIYAAGDCVETYHRLLSTPTYLPLGTTAHKQGRVAGENALGGYRSFAGSLGTQVVKVFDLAIARTGINDVEAAAAGFAPLTVASTQWDHKRYYPGAHELHLRITGDRRTGQLLGAQMVGNVQAEVAKRIDVFATALFHGMRVKDLEDLDLSYTPPLGSPWDAVQLSTQTWVHHSQERFPARSA